MSGGQGGAYGRSMYLPFNFAVNLKPKSIKRNIGMRKILEMQTMIFPLAVLIIRSFQQNHEI